MTEVNRVWRLRKRPVGDIADDVLSFEEEAIPEPAAGECLLRLNYLSLDPTNRVWMSDMDSTCRRSNSARPCAAWSRHGGEEQHAEVRVRRHRQRARRVGRIPVGRPGFLNKMPETGGIPLVDAFGTFAVVGPTAYFGLLDIGAPKAGETVVISAAAGAVGSIVGQIAKIKGCRAVGLAGSDEKCRWITAELGFDAAINYKTADLPAALAAACPDGIDIYFDNVGGDILDACLKKMNLGGRIPTCGLISQYNATGAVPGPRNYPMILMQRLKVQG